MSDIGSFAHGGGPQKKDLLPTGHGSIHYGQIYTRYGVSASETLSFVSNLLAAKSKKAFPGDVIIADTSENDEDLGKAVAWLGRNAIAVSNHTLIFRSKHLDPEFISHFLRSQSFQRQKPRLTTGTKVRSISAASMGKVKVPVPSSEIQRKTVDTLNRFDALVKDISVGLPAELASRRKQYEYYRDKILTFREAR